MSLISGKFTAINSKRLGEHLLTETGLWNILQQNRNFIFSLGLVDSFNKISPLFYQPGQPQQQPPQPFIYRAKNQNNTATGINLDDRLYKMLNIIVDITRLFKTTVIHLIESGFQQDDAIKKGTSMAKQNFMKIIKDRNLDKPTRQEIYFIKSLQLDPSQEKREIAKLNYKF